VIGKSSVIVSHLVAEYQPVIYLRYNIHICNMKDWFTEICPSTGNLFVDDPTTVIEGYGNAY
jgi:hypothetical protein